MDARKVQRVGQSTLAVSLPKRWAEEVNLKRGDTVFFKHESDHSLRLMPSALAERKAAPRVHVVNADQCSEPRMLERVIVGNYILGHDSIWITSTRRLRSSHVEETRGITSKLMGLAIMEETPNNILLQCSIDPVKFPVRTLMRRLYIIASTMHKEAVQALVDCNSELAEESIRRENEADTLYWLIVRLLISSQQDRSIAKKIGVEDMHQITGNRTIAAYLERIADWGEIIARDAVEIIERRDDIEDYVIEGISRISELAYDICSKAMRCLFANDIRLANEAIETYKGTVEVEEQELVKRIAVEASGPHACPYLRRVLLAIRRIAELGAEISQVTINTVLERSSDFCEIRLHEEGKGLGDDRNSELGTFPGI